MRVSLVVLAAVAALGAPPAVDAQSSPQSLSVAPSVSAWVALPDWSGDWVLAPSASDPPPPYNPQWAKKRQLLGAAVKAGKASDPLDVCGRPAGAPRMLSLPGVHEFILRPGEVWHAVEDGNTVQRIYTDGRKHRQGVDLFPTYTGDNIGRWDGQTLVIDTVGLRDDTWLGPLLPHSARTHVLTELRRVGPDLVAQIQVNDSEAFIGPWLLMRRYRRLPPGDYVHDYVCKVVRTAKDAAELN